MTSKVGRCPTGVRRRRCRPADLDVPSAIVSVSAPGATFLPQAADAAALARDLNDFNADVVASRPDRFGFFATIPMPHVDEAVSETVRALDELKADGVVLLANHGGTYLGENGQDELFKALDTHSAVVFIHPADLPCPTVPGIPPFATDFLLDTLPCTATPAARPRTSRPSRAAGGRRRTAPLGLHPRARCCRSEQR
jgi:predicted TIM-barrel fold metal-dependent hydrolase